MTWTRTRCDSATCVEVAVDEQLPTMVWVRTSNHPQFKLALSRAELVAYNEAVKRGEWDWLKDGGRA